MYKKYLTHCIIINANNGGITMGKLKFICGNIVDDDILKLGDAIVLPTNPMMRCGAGVSGEIFKKAGADALERYIEISFGISYDNPPGMNEMKVCETRITPGFDLPCEIIFAQGPKVYEYENYNEALQLLLLTYKNILKTAIDNKYQSILLPAMGTGSYGFSHSSTAEYVVNLLNEYLLFCDLTVYFVIYEQNALNIYLTANQ